MTIRVEVLNSIDIGVAPDPKNPMNDICTMNKVVEYMAMSKPIVSFDLKEARVSAGAATGAIACQGVPALGARRLS